MQTGVGLTANSLLELLSSQPSTREYCWTRTEVLSTSMYPLVVLVETAQATRGNNQLSERRLYA